LTKMPPKKEGAKKRKADQIEVPKRMKPASVKRKSKEVKRFVELKVPRVEKEIVVPKGKGKKLGDCENLASEIKKRTKSDDLLKTIHTIALGKPGKTTNIKENLEKFNGIVYDSKFQRKNLESKLFLYTMRLLKDVAAMFGVDPEGKREELVEKIADFLEKPHQSDKHYHISKSSAGKGKAKGRSSSQKPRKKRKKDPNAPKRALSSYMFFCMDKRPEVTKKNPNDPVTEIAKKLAVKWNKLTASDKKPFEAQSAKDKQRYVKEMSKYTKKK